jgi:hypothetical protein
LESPKGEVLDEITRDHEQLFFLKSSQKRYTSLKAAQAEGKKNQENAPS